LPTGGPSTLADVVSDEIAPRGPSEDEEAAEVERFAHRTLVLVTAGIPLADAVTAALEVEGEEDDQEHELAARDDDQGSGEGADAFVRLRPPSADLEVTDDGAIAPVEETTMQTMTNDAAAQASGARRERGDLRECLVDVLRAGARTSTQLAAELGADVADVRRMLRWLRDEGLAHATVAGSSSTWSSGPAPARETAPAAAAEPVDAPRMRSKNRKRSRGARQAADAPATTVSPELLAELLRASPQRLKAIDRVLSRLARRP
jgi:hypothetical protein